HPSIDEGFGLPIVEAIHFKLPFAAANNTAMPEIGEKAGTYFDPYKIEEIKNAIVILHENDVLKKELIQHAKMIESRYQWDLAARQILDIFTSK
ncbi:MAG: glycosyltransferase, partial [Chitinophagaceae bacterium]